MNLTDWIVICLSLLALAIGLFALWLSETNRRPSSKSTLRSPSPTEQALKEAWALQDRMTREFEPQLTDLQGREVKIRPEPERPWVPSLAVKSSTVLPSRLAGRLPDWTMPITWPAGLQLEVTLGKADVFLETGTRPARLLVFSKSTGPSGGTTAEPTLKDGPIPSTTSRSDSASLSTPSGQMGPGQAGVSPGRTHTHEWFEDLRSFKRVCACGAYENIVG